MRTRLDHKESIIIRPSKQQKFDGYKPEGFWYSVDRGWEEWCRSEMPEWLYKRYEHRVELGEEKMLYIRSLADIDAFHEKYKMNKAGLGFDHIDWLKVGTEYDGIEIAPYQWKRRHEMMWYYGWDCASGCIWRPKGVKTVLVGGFTLLRSAD